MLEKAFGDLLSGGAVKAYAVLDGAQIEDLPQKLSDAGLWHMSLYKGNSDSGLIEAGPWLVDPNQPLLDAKYDLEPLPDDVPLPKVNSSQQLQKIINLVGETPAAVFWLGDMTAEALYRHLRGLNQILLPKDLPKNKTAQESSQEAGAPETSMTELVIFRHYDGNVLANVLPVLDGPQFARLFGPARMLVFNAPDFPSSNGSPLRRAALPFDVPHAPVGLLRLDEAQVEEIKELRLARSRRRIMAYLRETAPNQTGTMNDAALEEHTKVYMKEAQSFGVRSEAAMGRWSYLQLQSGNQLYEDKQIQKFMTSDEVPLPPDERVRALMQGTAQWLEERGM